MPNPNNKKPLRIREALKLAQEISSLMDEFVQDIENGEDDPENGVEGFKPGDLVRDVEHVEHSVAVLEHFRSL